MVSIGCTLTLISYSNANFFGAHVESVYCQYTTFGHSVSSVSKLRLLKDSCLLRWPPLANDGILGILACPCWRELPCLNGGGEHFPPKLAARSAVTGSMLLNGLGLGTLNTSLS